MRITVNAVRNLGYCLLILLAPLAARSQSFGRTGPPVPGSPGDASSVRGYLIDPSINPNDQDVFTYDATRRLWTARAIAAVNGSMIFPPAGIPQSTGTAWGTSLTLAPVATSGRYSDLTGTPTIPAALSIDGNTGAFTFGGSGVTHSGNTYTFTNSGGGASTPATSSLLKGNGSANGVVAATVGTDYDAPGAAAAAQAASVPLAGGTMTGALNAPVISGVAYSALYPGASLDVRVNACLADAETGAHGATSHRCSSLGEPNTLTASNGILAQINVGDSSSDTVTWEVPDYCAWTMNISGGTAVGIMQYPKSSIIGHGEQRGNCTVINQSPANGPLYMYSLSGALGFFQLDGMSFRNAPGVGDTLAGGAMLFIQNAEDNSSWKNMGVNDYVPGTIGTILAGGSNIDCCSLSFENDYWYGNNTGGVLISSTGNNGSQGVQFWSDSIGHTAPGTPLTKFTDNAGTNSVQFHGTYEEVTIPAITVTGYSFAGGVLTVTNSGTNGLVAGSTVSFSSFTNATYGPILLALSNSSQVCTALSTGLSATQVEFTLSACSGWSRLTSGQQSTANGTSGAITDAGFLYATTANFALNQISGGSGYQWTGLTVENVQSSALYNALMFSIASSANPPQLTVIGLSAHRGLFTLNGIAFNANLSNKIAGLTDANGAGSYISKTSSFDTVNSLSYLLGGTAWLGSNTAPGPLQCDGTTTNCTGGVISSIGGSGGASTPATTNLLKGNGSANGVVAATPGTDYDAPGAAAAAQAAAEAAFTGDVTKSANAFATTLATVNSNTGACGDSTHVCQVTLDGKGRATAATPIAISSGLSNPMSASGDMIGGGASGAPTRIAAPTVGTVPYNLIEVPGSAPVFGLAGIAGRSVAGTTDTIAATDRGSSITSTSSSAVSEALTSAVTLGSHFDFVTGVQGTGVVTFTPGAGTINGGSTLALSQGDSCAINSQDNTNYVARCSPGLLTAGSGVTITPTANGKTISATGSGPLTIAGGGLTPGNIYYASSGGLSAAEANLSTTVPAICYATSSTACQINGTVTTSGLTAGAIYYVSDSSAGTITATAPTTSGHFVQRFGVALSTTVLLVNPSLDVITHP